MITAEKKTGARKTDRSSDPRTLALEMLTQSRESDLDWDSRLEACSPKDRALARQIVSGTLRTRGKIDYYLGFFLQANLKNLPPEVRNILRMAVFQLKFCDRIPDYAVVNEAVEAAGRLSAVRYKGLVNGVLRTLLRQWDSVVLPDAEKKPLEYLSVNYSHPRWLVARYLQRFGYQHTEALLKANNSQAPLVIRSEEMLAGGLWSRSKLRKMLATAGIQLRQGAYLRESLVLQGESLRPSELPGYCEGLFYIQDEAAMLVAHLAAPETGCVIFDLCAAPGGKATHLARLAGPDSLVAACDRNRKRLARLRLNLARLGLGNVRLVAGDASRPAVRCADLVLLDVPCTGTGAMRRKPDLRWRISEKDLKDLVRLQSAILAAGAGCVRPGGALVYSTCSIEPEENRGVVGSWLAKTTDFYLEPAGNYLPKELVSPDGYLETLPHLHGMDGTFAARLVRKK
jgi:16S rRNA (cytosine967-C5)-methyltransferase